MADLLVRDIDPNVLERLREKATAQGKSMAQTAREALAAYVKPDKTEAWARADQIRKAIGKVSGDSTEIIRAWRDNDERYR